jgi:hypothetical protein
VKVFATVSSAYMYLLFLGIRTKPHFYDDTSTFYMAVDKSIMYARTLRRIWPVKLKDNLEISNRLMQDAFQANKSALSTTPQRRTLKIDEGHNSIGSGPTGLIALWITWIMATDFSNELNLRRDFIDDECADVENFTLCVCSY